jgi:hypothetical protein
MGVKVPDKTHYYETTYCDNEFCPLKHVCARADIPEYGYSSIDEFEGPSKDDYGRVIACSGFVKNKKK